MSPCGVTITRLPTRLNRPLGTRGTGSCKGGEGKESLYPSQGWRAAYLQSAASSQPPKSACKGAEAPTTHASSAAGLVEGKPLLSGAAGSACPAPLPCPCPAPLSPTSQHGSRQVGHSNVGPCRGIEFPTLKQEDRTAHNSHAHCQPRPPFPPCPLFSQTRLIVNDHPSVRHMPVVVACPCSIAHPRRAKRVHLQLCRRPLALHLIRAERG